MFRTSFHFKNHFSVEKQLTFKIFLISRKTSILTNDNAFERNLGLLASRKSHYRLFRLIKPSEAIAFHLKKKYRYVHPSCIERGHAKNIIALQKNARVIQFIHIVNQNEKRLED